MSAEVRTEYVVYCAHCNEGAGPYEDDDDADAWAAEHDAEYHNEPDRDDDNRDHHLDLLKEDR